MTTRKLFERLKKPSRAAPAVPMGTVVYAIGDIHGRLDLLRVLEAKICIDAKPRDVARRVVVYLGDYIDRGSQSREVLDHLLAGPPANFEQICLMGNHEVFLLQYLCDAATSPVWFANGGLATLLSYGVTLPEGFAMLESSEKVHRAFREALPQAHLDFLRKLALTHREGDYLFVHAGIRPGRALHNQDPHDLLWIRDEFATSEVDFGVVVVHGHTPCAEPIAKANRINIDTGAHATGRLTCLVLEKTSREFLRT